MNALVDYAAAELPVGDEAAVAHNAALDAIAEPGAWWSGSDRLAIAEKARVVPDRAWRAAGSPDAAQGPYAKTVEAIHGIRHDSGGITRRWFDGIVNDEGLQPEEYVELASVVASVVIVDTFAQGVGLPPPALPEAVPGAPSFERSDDVVEAGAYLPLAREGRAHILRSLGLVPSASQLFFHTFNPSYMRSNREFALTRAQVELVASRVSAVNECFY